MYTVSFLYYRQDFKWLYYKEHDLPTLRNQLGLAIFLFVSSMFLNFIFFSVVCFVFAHLCSVSYLRYTFNVGRLSGLSILDCHFGFLYRLFTIQYHHNNSNSLTVQTLTYIKPIPFMMLNSVYNYL
jgi:hypothetical protein